MQKFASIYIKKVSTGKNVTQAMQIAVIYEEENELKCLHYFIENDVKKSKNSTKLKTCLLQIYKVIFNKTIVLQNYNNLDYLYLKKCFSIIKLEFNNPIIDITKIALKHNIKKPNIDNLCRIYNISTDNNKKIPCALFEARKLYLLAIKMHNNSSKNNE